MKLLANLRDAHSELLAGVLEERGRGFSSDREAWAELKEHMENIEACKRISGALHQDMWSAVKERNGDAFCVLCEELERTALATAAK